MKSSNRNWTAFHQMNFVAFVQPTIGCVMAMKLKANFNPNQLRDDQGRWADTIDNQQGASESVGNAVNNTALESFAAASRRGRSAAFCVAQYAVDSLLCNSVKPASRARACWTQAAERLGNCLSGRPIPPLNY
jgi:hypothetical protein